MKLLRRLGIAVFILSFIACLCSLTPLTLRYFREDWSDLSYQSPDEIIILLRSEIPPDTTSFETVQSVMQTHGVSNCRTTTQGQCVRCTTPVGIASPLDAMKAGWNLGSSVYWWWIVSTFDFDHEISISIVGNTSEEEITQNRIGVETQEQSSGWWVLSTGRGGRCARVNLTETGVHDSFPDKG